jgi:hypothetical protein
MNHCHAFAALAAALTLFTTAPARADAVAHWFSVLQELTGRVPPATDPVAEQATPLVALAMYDAIVAVEGGYKPYLGMLKTPRGASAAAAAHAAAHTVLTQLYPDDRVRLNGVYDQALAQEADNPHRKAGVTAGVEAAHRLLQHRGIAAVEATTAYRPVTRPGHFVPPQLPAREWLSRFRPFTAGLEHLHTPGPPTLDSAEYASDYAEVQSLGGRHSSRRTPEQSAIAQFWNSTDLMQLLPQVFAREGRTLSGNARLLAIYATAQFDAGILLARDKYHYNFWRPVTAIRNADDDGNAATTRDATWEPLLATPSHPDYPCGHCMMSALVATIMAAEVGPAPASGIVVSGSSPAMPARRFADFAQMADEASNSRVWGGVHFRKGASDGAELGRSLARHILTTEFLPMPPLQSRFSVID